MLVPNGRTLPDGPSRDFVSYQLPIREYARSEMLAGRFPLWIPYLCGGLPLHASQQASLCHPLLTPLILVLGAGYGLKLCLLLHLAIGYAGTYRWARFLGSSRPAGGLAGILATWSGFAVNHLMAGHVTLLLQYALVPWFFHALCQMRLRPGPWPAAALSMIGACFAVSGHPQVFYYCLLLGSLWAAGSLLAGDARRARRRFLAWVFGAAILGLLISSVQVLPSIELARDGLAESFRARSGFPRQHALTGLDVIRLAIPDLAGNPFREPRGTGVGENFHERVVYLGLAAPLLALYGLSRGTVARWQWGAAWLLVLSLAIGLGDSSPAFEPLRASLPGLNLFRCPGRVFGVASIFAAILAARGLDSLVQRERGAPGVAFISLAWCLISLAGFAVAYNKDGVAWPVYAENALHDVVHACAPAIFAVATLIALLVARRWGIKHRNAAYALVIGLTFADLYWANIRNFHLELPASVRLPEPLLAAGLPRRFVESPEDGRIGSQQLRYSQFVPAALAARRQLLGTKEGGVLPASTERLFRAVQSRPQVALALAGCDYRVSAGGGCTALPTRLPRIRFIAHTDNLLVDRPVAQTHDADIRRIRASAILPPRVMDETAQRIAFDVVAPVAGQIVLADTWYPGWVATVDGSVTSIDSAHGVFRAVKLSEGRHEVVFSYRPISFRLGFAGTFVGVALSTALFLFGSRREQRMACRSNVVMKVCRLRKQGCSVTRVGGD